MIERSSVIALQLKGNGNKPDALVETGGTNISVLSVVVEGSRYPQLPVQKERRSYATIIQRLGSTRL